MESRTFSKRRLIAGAALAILVWASALMPSIARGEVYYQSYAAAHNVSYTPIMAKTTAPQVITTAQRLTITRPIRSKWLPTQMTTSSLLEALYIRGARGRREP